MARRSGDAMSSPNPQPKKSISINLMDLNKKHARKESPTACIAPQISQSDVRIDNLLGNDNVYEKELLKLLEKAKGTPYENSVRKFLSSKLGTSHVTPSRDDTDASSYGTAEEDLMAKQRALSRQRTRIDVLAQPLLRQEPQSSPRKFNYISTNTLGRQRPSPAMADHRRPIGAGPISLRDFNGWLRRTSRWKQEIDDSICTEQQQRQTEELTKNFHPKIGSRSAKLARRAHSREFDQLQQGYSDAAAAAPPISGVSEGRSELCSIDADDDISDIADEDRSQRHVVFNNQDLQLNARNGIEERPESEKELPSSGQPVVVDPVVPSHTRAASPSNVYDRLSARGRDYAQRRLNWAPPKNMFSFHPEIDTKSLKIAAKRNRSMSADKSVTSCTEMSQSQQENTNPLSNLACDPNATPLITGKNPSQTDSPAITEVRRGRSPSRDYRSRSASRKRSGSRGQVNEDLTFKPTLSRESMRIVARKNETFTDRLNKSVENFHVLNIVSRRSGSPGPGYYSNVNVPVSASRAVKLQSPGKGGYSFGKYTKDLDISLKY